MEYEELRLTFKYADKYESKKKALYYYEQLWDRREFTKNLTAYRKERNDSRERSKSPEYKYKPSHKKGNGVPNDLVNRLYYLAKIINKEEFIKYYQNRPRGNNFKFEAIYDYIMNYKKTHTDFESVLMLYYFICNDIKYYSKEALEKLKEKYKNKFEYIIFSDTQFFEDNYVPKPQEVFMKGIALNPNYFSNVFEFFLKKMEIKYKHIEGYCKLIPHNNIIHTNKLNNNKNLKIKINDEDEKMKYLTRYNTSENSKESKIKTFKSTSNLLFGKIDNNEENNLPINHCWNAIYIRGEWYFVDTLLGSGGTSGESAELLNNNVNDKKFCEDIDIFFNPFYFMPLPKYLIMTHRPKEDIWQFVDKIMTPIQFMNKNNPDIAQFYRGVYQYNVELLTHKYPIIDMTIKDELTIELRLKKAVLQSDLYDITGKTKIADVKYSYIEKKNIFIFEPSFPCNGDYLIRVKCRSLTSTDLIYWPLVDYIVKIHNKLATFSHFDKYKKIKISEDKNIFDKKPIMTLPKLNNNANSQTINKPKIINDYSNFFPSKLNKKICYDNDGFFLIEPRIPYLKKGNVIKFKVIVKGANYVTLLDGNHWSTLKKTDKDTFEGEKNIKTDNVSICCLKSKNIFTEVYKFKFVKEKSLDTKFFMAKLMKNKSKIKSIV